MSGDTLAALRRRRSASRRLPPLDCGCRDPLPCRCDDPPLSDRIVDSYHDTVMHLRACGLLAAPRLPEMRVLWRRGDVERRLVTEISEKWELAG